MEATEIIITGQLGSLDDESIRTDLSSVGELDGVTKDVHLQGSDISEILRHTVTAVNASFWKTRAKQCEVTGCFFAGCTFQEVNFREMSFANCSFSGCWFDLAVLKDVEFVNCQINESMRGSSLERVGFSSCDLHINLDDASLKQVSFSDLSVDGIEFATRENIDLALMNITGVPYFRNLNGSMRDLKAFRDAGWRFPRIALNDREDQLRRIEREFGDETEAWYQKWISGLLD